MRTFLLSGIVLLGDLWGQKGLIDAEAVSLNRHSVMEMAGLHEINIRQAQIRKWVSTVKRKAAGVTIFVLNAVQTRRPVNEGKSYTYGNTGHARKTTSPNNLEIAHFALISF